MFLHSFDMLPLFLFYHLFNILILPLPLLHLLQSPFLFLKNMFIDFSFFFFFGCTGSSLLCTGFSLVAASRGYSLFWCMGFSLQWFLLSWSIGCRHTGSVAVAHRLSSCVSHRLNCSAACGIFPDQGSNLCLLYWQVNSYPLSHQGNPFSFLFISIFILPLFSPPRFSFLLALNIFSFPPYSFFPLHL